VGGCIWWAWRQRVRTDHVEMWAIERGCRSCSGCRGRMRVGEEVGQNYESYQWHVHKEQYSNYVFLFVTFDLG